MTEKTFTNFDKFGRQDFAVRLTKVIATFSPFANGAYVLGLNASFGAGKTTFLEMWKQSLTQEGYKVVYLNTWETDFADDPLVPIANSLIEFLKNENGDKAEKAKKSLQGIVGVAALVGNAVLEKATGVNVQDTLEKVGKDLANGEMEELGDKISQAFSARINIYQKLKESLMSYVEGLDKKPLVVLVDELDRVRPDYAIKFLEAVKHIFAIKGICFVLAADREQLEKSTRQIYGDIDFENYYRRFVTREVNLPVPSIVNWEKFIQQISQEYFDVKLNNGVPTIFNQNNDRSIAFNYATQLCAIFALTPRQAEYLFRVYSQFMAVDAGQNRYMPVWIRMPIFLIVLLIIDKEKYHRIGKGQFSPRELFDLLKSLKFKSERDRDICFKELAAFLLTSENDTYQNELFSIHIEIINPSDGQADVNAVVKNYARLLDPHQFGDLPHNESSFQNLYNKLEDWRTYLE